MTPDGGEGAGVRDTAVKVLSMAAGATIAVAIVLAYPPARATIFGAAGVTAPSVPAPAAMLAVSIPAGATDVGVRAPLVVTATHGTLNTVTVTGPDGHPMVGTLSPDHTRWTSPPLDYGRDYRVGATGTGADGHPAAPLSSTFRTLSPARTLDVVSTRPANGDTVGVAMPISISFSRPVADRAAVERTLTVTPSVPTEGSFSWFDDQRVDWRPKQFWTPGTTVRVDADLHGVNTGRGAYGAADHSMTFTIGAGHGAIGDARTHTLTLWENGKPVRTLPASFGKPEYQTHSGVHVAMQKYPVKEMRSDSWVGGPKQGEPGYYDVFEPLAVRISNNGEFVHVNNLTVHQQGRTNVSHGCVNLSMANGQIFYNWVQVGDPVDIQGTSVPLSPSEGDIGAWVTPWDRWVAGSALHGVTEAPFPGMFPPTP